METTKNYTVKYDMSCMVYQLCLYCIFNVIYCNYMIHRVVIILYFQYILYTNCDYTSNHEFCIMHYVMEHTISKQAPIEQYFK